MFRLLRHALDNNEDTDRDTIADLEEALADAKAAVKTEHMVVAAKVYDAMGMMMADVSLCLAENTIRRMLNVLRGMEMRHDR